MTNITAEQFGQMQDKVNSLAKKKKTNHISVGGFVHSGGDLKVHTFSKENPIKKIIKGRPNLKEEQKTLYEQWYGDKITIKIKPLSSNDAWQGRRFKSPLYKQYETDLLELLPKLKLPSPPYKITYEFGFSNKQSDIDNPVKSFGDILQKKYKFNDNQIYEMHIYKKIVKKLGEYISFKIESIN